MPGTDFVQLERHEGVHFYTLPAECAEVEDDGCGNLKTANYHLQVECSIMSGLDLFA